MNFLDSIDKKTIIVCPYSVKNSLLEVINTYDRLINVKLYTLEEIKRLVYFDYDVDAILYLMDKYLYTYEVAKNYIDNLYYIEDKKYDNKKLDFLVKLKKELLDNNLLEIDSLFVDSNKNKPFIVFGYDYLTSFDKKILSNFDYTVIDKELKNNHIKVHGFNNLEEELLFVINEIVSLIKKGVSVNDISLINLDSNYNNEIIRLFDMFKLPVDINRASSLLSTTIGNKTLEHLKTSQSFEDSLNYLKEITGDNDAAIYSMIVNIFNNYVSLDYSFDSILKAVEYEFRNTSINNNSLKNMIRVGSLENSYYKDSSYVFLLGFNQGSIPKVMKDEDYINDELKKYLGLDTVYVINKLERNATINNIKAIKNLYVSYKLSYLDSEFYKSNLINESIFEEVENDELSTVNSYQYSLIKLSLMLDDLIKYDVKDKDLGKYFNSFDSRYMDYDNRFKGINKKDLYKFIDNKLTLSYSTIDTFYKCQFRYYIDNILKLNKYEETFDTIIGSLFHYVLSHVYDDDFNLDKNYDYFLKDKTFTNKESFYLEKLRKELIIICNRLNDFKNDTGLTKVFTEKNIKVDKSSDIEVIFKGIVDKIMYKEYDGQTLLAIIDYKTGSADIDITNAVYGIGMQLIIYLYLISKSDLFDNYSCVGFYLQRILSGEVNIEKDRSYIDIKNDNLKLYGYSNSDTLKLERFDPTYNNSIYIKSMKTTKTGFYAYTKVLDDDTMKELTIYVDKKIDEARDKILDGDFSINPKNIIGDKEIIGCKYCRYFDICNRKNEDIVDLKKYKDLSFLKEGDIDA